VNAEGKHRPASSEVSIDKRCEELFLKQGCQQNITNTPHFVQIRKQIRSIAADSHEDYYLPEFIQTIERCSAASRPGVKIGMVNPRPTDKFNNLPELTMSNLSTWVIISSDFGS
jgi:hypothetical protein